MVDYKDKMFYSEMKKVDNNTISIKGYKNLGNGDYSERSISISPKSIPRIVNILDNYNGLKC